MKNIRQKNSQLISKEDILQSLKNISPLGNGFGVLHLGKKIYIQSVPCELSQDHNQILLLAEKSGNLTLAEMMEQLKWEKERIITTLDLLLQESIVWVDFYENKTTYWFPGLVNQEIK